MQLCRSTVYAVSFALSVTLAGVLTGCADGGHDSTPPAVVATVPVDGATGVYPDSSISITFSERMDQAAVELALTAVPDLPDGTFSWNPDANTVTYTPDTPADVPVSYAVTVGVGATDRAGNPLETAYAFSWRTGLPYTALELESDLANPTSSYGVFPSNDGKYFFWSEDGDYFKRVKIADRSSELIWSNNDRSSWGVYDDGVETWVGNYWPPQGTRITYTNPITLDSRYISYAHTIGLAGNDLSFPYVYFGNSEGTGIGYWNRDTDATGRMGSGWIYQSAVIGDRIYFPGGYYSTPGIYVVDAAGKPTTIEKTLLSGDGRLANATDICADETYLYVRRSDVSPPYANEMIYKIDPSGNSGNGEVVAGFNVDSMIPTTNNLGNIAVVGGNLYAGVNNDSSVTNKNVYIIDKVTGSYQIRDCTDFLPAPTGVPMWDYNNDGIWFGPTQAVSLDKWAFFIPRKVIETACPDITAP